jgi:hypothetical protein
MVCAVINGSIALATVGVQYAALWLADLALKIDFRPWIVALKLMCAKQIPIVRGVFVTWYGVAGTATQAAF